MCHPFGWPDASIETFRVLHIKYIEAMNGDLFDLKVNGTTFNDRWFIQITSFCGKGRGKAFVWGDKWHAVQSHTSRATTNGMMTSLPLSLSHSACPDWIKQLPNDHWICNQSNHNLFRYDAQQGCYDTFTMPFVLCEQEERINVCTHKSNLNMATQKQCQPTSQPVNQPAQPFRCKLIN